jgi:hypothetical protein
MGFGHGQLSNQRGIKGFPKATTETYYLEVPGPAELGDLVVVVLGETELIFGVREFETVAGPSTDSRYLPNFFRDTRDDRLWARLAGLDVNYPLEDFVAAWPSSDPPSAWVVETTPPDSDDLFRDFKPQSSGDYVARVEGQVLVKTRAHERLVADFGLWSAANGYAPSTIEHPRDLVLYGSGRTVLVEAKMLYRHNATNAVRAAIGQLLTYRHLLYRDDAVSLLALFSEPVGGEYVELLTTLGIAAVWRGDPWAASVLAAEIGLTP